MKKITWLPVMLFAFTGAIAQRSTGDRTSAAEFNAILKAANRSMRDFENLPDSFTLRNFAPIPQNQGPYGTCVAWSSAYAARTISYAVKRNMTNTESIKKNAFSPAYLYYKVKPATDKDCSEGASILDAMVTMKKSGAMLKKETLADCALKIPESAEKQKATPYKIKDYLSLNNTYDSITKNDIQKIKKSIAEKKPVVISIRIDTRLEKTPASGIWNSGDDDGRRHAMCIIGYNNKIAGGAFEVMNSWGTKWGNKGFFWLSYAQVMKKGGYAVQLMDFEAGEISLSGEIEFIQVDEKNQETMMPVARKKISANQATVKNDTMADYSLYQLTETYRGGTRFKLKFKTNSPSYIYVFAEDKVPSISRLFPPDSTVSAAINSANATYYLPSDSTSARLDTTIGKENFCILYSKSEIDFEGLTKYIRESKTSIFQGVKNKLGDRLLDMEKVLFTDDKITFLAPAEDGSVLCFFVEMNHN